MSGGLARKAVSYVEADSDGDDGSDDSDDESAKNFVAGAADRHCTCFVCKCSSETVGVGK